MNIKKIRIAIIAVTTISFIFVFFSNLPGLTSAGSSLFYFSKGMLSGMSLVVMMAWLYFMIRQILDSYKSGTLVLVIKSKKIIYSFVMFGFLSGTVLTTYYSNNALLLVTCAVIMATGYSVYFFSKDFSSEKFCNKAGRYSH